MPFALPGQTIVTHRGRRVVVGKAASGPAVGQQLFTANGTFVVPAGVTSISAVAIGAGGPGETVEGLSASGSGGGLAYSNGITVTPGETLTVEVAPPTGTGGLSALKRGAASLVAATSSGLSGARGAGTVGDVLRIGGTGAGWTDQAILGAGAAGYTANGEDGKAGAGGFGGSGVSANGGTAGGTSGASPNANGGAYGGGGGVTGIGGSGCVRVIWGEGRAYPNTNTGDA